MEFIEKATFEIDGSNHSSMMIFCGEHNSHKMISIMPTFIIDSTSISQIFTFYKRPTHVVQNYLFLIQPITNFSD